MPILRRLGTMVVHALPGLSIQHDLGLAHRLGASCVEILPDFGALPDPVEIGRLIRGEGLILHSMHGCWGSRTIAAERVDLGAIAAASRSAGCEDIERCVEWLAAAGGSNLVVHPGGLSDAQDFQARRAALLESLTRLAEFASSSPVVICVENMPPGVFPGSRMHDLATLVAEIDHPHLGLALDTGHAHIMSNPVEETLAAGSWLRTTHVHDNDGRTDSHLPPGLGTLDFTAWIKAINAIGYSGPIMLECIRQIRQRPAILTDAFLQTLRDMTGAD